MEDNSAADFIGDPCCDCSSWILANTQRPTNPCNAACLHLPTPIGVSLRTPSSVWPTLCGMKTTMRHRRSSNVWSTLSGETLGDNITDLQHEGSIPAVGAGFVRSVQVVPPGTTALPTWVLPRADMIGPKQQTSFMDEQSYLESKVEKAMHGHAPENEQRQLYGLCERCNLQLSRIPGTQAWAGSCL